MKRKRKVTRLNYSSGTAVIKVRLRRLRKDQFIVQMRYMRFCAWYDKKKRAKYIRLYLWGVDYYQKNYK